jgi:diacylglycerol kinase (ATP)
MYQAFGDLVVAITEHPQQVAEHLDKARAAGLTRIIAVGGDGTCHALVNAILDLQTRQPDGPPLTFGQLPIGTGQDFARALGIPTKPEEAIRWLARAQVRPLDVGAIVYNSQQAYFLNIASAGMSGEVDKYVARHKRRPWTFRVATLRTILRYRPPHVQIWLDDQAWYEGEMWLLAAANGTTFGRGMAIAPHACLYDGQLDTVLVKKASRFTLLQAFGSVYRGKHLQRPEVAYQKAQTIRLRAENRPLELDLDGEPESAQEVTLRVLPAALPMLCHL